MKTKYKSVLSLLLLCLFGAAGKGYGQETGTVLWEFKTKNNIYSSPAIAEDGTVYIGSGDGFLYAINTNGEKLWECNIGSIRKTPAIDSDGTIYVSTSSYVFAINPDGTEKWNFHARDTIRSSVSVGNNDNLYFVAGRALFSISKNRILNWSYKTESFIDSKPVIGKSGVIYIASRDHNLYAIKSNGEKKWSYKTGDQIRSNIAIDNDETIYFGSNDARFYAIKSDGSLKWSYKAYAKLQNSPVIDSNNIIWFNSEKNIWGLDLDGNKKTVGSFDADASLLTVASDNSVLYGSNTGKLKYSIIKENATRHNTTLMSLGQNLLSSISLGISGEIYITSGNSIYSLKSKLNLGPSHSYWPMFGQNIQRTSSISNGPLKIIGFPEKLYTNLGENNIISYSLTGAFPRTYQWQRNGVAIPGATKPFLTIENATNKDVGLYRVTITNKHGSVTSDEAVLKVVTPGAPQIFAEGNEVVGSVVKGDKAEITLSTSFEGGSIFYTLDGSEPSFESAPYQSPFTVSKTTGIRAIAYKEDFSDIAEADPVFINIVPNYNLNVSVQGQGTIVKEPADGPYIQDSVVKLKAIPEQGWRFAGWNGALKSSFTTGSIVMGSAKSVMAKFEKIPRYKLEKNKSVAGVIIGDFYNSTVVWSEAGELIKFKQFKYSSPKPKGNHIKTIIKVWGQPSPSFPDLFQFLECRISIVNNNNNKKYTVLYEGPGMTHALIHDNSFWSENDLQLLIKRKHKDSLFDGYGKINKIDFEYIYEDGGTFERSFDEFERTHIELEQFTITAKPNAGFKFLSWKGDASGTDPKIKITMDRDKAVEAVFGTELATTATGNGKLIIDPPDGPYPYGEKVKINPVPNKGYYLGVWGGDAFGLPKGPIEYEITKANPKITALFAPLKENRFTVTTLTSSGGTVVSNPNSNAYVNGQEVTITANPDPGYSFVGWTGDIESTSNPLVTLADANKTVTAQFRRNIIAPVTLTINAENGTVTRTPADELYEKGTSVELLAQPNPGYTFTGWTGALGGTASRTTVFLDGDKTVTANFKASYQLAAETRGPGSVLTTPSSTTFIDGDEVILTASPAEGYGFVGWTGDLESTNQQTTLAMDSNKRVIAHFAQLGTLTTWTRGEGTITRSPDKESYFPGAKVTLTAKPGDGFQFVSWDGQASGKSNPTTVTMDRAMSVAANFKDIKAPTVNITSPAAQETGDETFTLSGAVTDNGKIKSLVWLWKGQEMGELELMDGKFELKDQKLAGGANAITVVATDRSDNEGKATVSPTWIADRSIRIAAAKEQQEGNRIEVPIEISSKGNVGGMGFVLNYDHSYLMDPVLTWSSAAGGSINLVNSEIAGELKGTFSLGGTSLPGGDQLIGTVSFRARSVPESLETVLGLQDLSISDSKGNKLTSGTDVVSGRARVLVRDITGDNNANDRLDVGDATRIQRLLVGLDRARAWDVSSNDLNGSWDLDPGDVVKVLRTVVGIDPQPKRNRVVAKMGGDDEAVETVMLAIKEKTASTVTVQVQLNDMQSTIAGANFQLEYPAELLKLKDKSSHAPGEIVAGNAAAIWNVSPAQTDYTKQDGTLAMAVSSPEPWTVKDGVLAEISFDVQNGADLNQAVLALSQVEVTPDGFDNRMLNGSSFNVGSGETDKPTEPSEVEIIGIENAPFGFSFNTEEGTSYEVQASDDLRKWEQLREVKGTGAVVKFVDFRKAFYQQQYYRVRMVE